MWVYSKADLPAHAAPHARRGAERAALFDNLSLSLCLTTPHSKSTMQSNAMNLGPMLSATSRSLCHTPSQLPAAWPLVSCMRTADLRYWIKLVALRSTASICCA